MEQHYYRLLDPRYEAGECFDTYEVEMSPRLYRSVQLSKIFTHLMLFWDISKVQLSTAFDILLNKDKTIEIMQKYSRKNDTHVPSSLFNSHEKQSFVFLHVIEQLMIPYEEFCNSSKLLGYDDIPAIWEYLWETVRTNFYKEKKSRMLSMFMYDNMEQIKKLQNEVDPIHLRTACEIIPLETESLDKYDGGWLDLVPVDCTFQEGIQYVRNYWEGRISDKPNMEYLFTGKCKIREL